MKKLALKINKYIYYGWVIVALSGITFFMSSPGQTYSISVFINEFKNELGYSNTMISSAYSLATILSGLLLIFIGRYVDKIGARKMLIISVLMLASATIFNSFVTNIYMIFAGFFLLRYFGQGSLTLIPNALIPQWFEKRRALAISISTIGSLLAALIVPALNLYLIKQIGWENAWRIWSLILAVLFIPLIFLLAVNKPEDIGLQIENDKDFDKKSIQASLDKIEKESFSLKEAAVTKEFWIVGFISMVPSMFSTGLTFHFYTIMETRSITNETAAIIIGLIAIPAFFTPFIARPIIDKYHPRNVLSITLLMVIVSMVFLTFAVTNKVSAIIFILFYGLSIAVQAVTLNVIWPNFYGRKHLGSIRGAATIFMVLGSALGPLPFGISYDLMGSFNPAIIGMIIFTSITFGFSMLVNKPQKSDII
jgi:MFS family permease